MVYFNMEDPLVGGYSADKVALRRALSLAMNVQREISHVRRGQAIAAQSIIAPGTYGYDPHYRSENSQHDPARAQALLDMYGYTDRNGDGWRDQPDGQPLVIEYATTPDGSSRQFDEVWQKNLRAIGVRTQFKVAKWPEQLKKARAAQLMVWQVGQSSEAPDVQDAFEMMYGPSAGNQNLARFKLPAFDALYERMQALPDGPERLAAMAEANKLLTAYMPQRYTVHRIVTDLAYPWVIGYRRPPFGNRWWQYVDIDNSQQPSP
jgi:ABC-type transport system substrate-binding protein